MEREIVNVYRSPEVNICYLFYRVKIRKATKGMESGFASVVTLNVALQQAETS